MLVEDDGDLRAALAELLSRKGCAVREASTVEAARVALSEAAVDVVLSDYELGTETASGLLAEAPSGVHLICLTGHTHPELPAGVRLLRKPVEIDELLGVVAEGITKGEPVKEATGAPVALRVALYLDSRSPMGARARRRFYETLARFSPDGAEVIEIDVRAGPPPEGVPLPKFLPSVCRLEPGPRLWLVGDLADVEPLEALLESGGVERLPEDALHRS